LLNEIHMGESSSDQHSLESFLGELSEIGCASALREMATGIAHELNQPLAAITTFAHAGERMLNRPEPLVIRALDVFKQISHEALSAGERLQKIRTLFDQERVPRPPCQIRGLLTEIQPVLERLAWHVKATLQLDIPDMLPAVRIDRRRIANVLISLVKNAVEASAAVTCERVVRIDASADLYALEIGVADLGAGVSDQEKGQLFHPFFTTKPGGTGLGLASSRTIIESHDGTIGFRNAPTGGVRFWFRLPVAQN
jgi:C4-dicarboxylate-specific signal transduction histidine kinase